ncbi:hypothetical protein ACQQ2N_06975 [Dokdonella sp. MW10]|uniref:hypothetical protein n=1 Tax=Dokdonella sp. MW10 TaxID=2992926 RepID=UPI003F7D6591
MRRWGATVVVLAVFAGGLWWGRASAPPGRPVSAGTPVATMQDRPAPAAPDAPAADRRTSSSGSAEEAWDGFRATRACQRLAALGSLVVDADEVDNPDAEARQREQELADLRTACGDARFTGWRDLARDLERAARLGSLEARLEYAVQPLLSPQTMAADVEAWAAWRERAPRYLDDAITRGDARAAAMIAIARDRDACPQPDVDARCARRDPLDFVYGATRDDAEALAYYLVAHALGDRTPYLDERLVTLGARLEPAALAAARERAAVILGRPPP